MALKLLDELLLEEGVLSINSFTPAILSTVVVRHTTIITIPTTSIVADIIFLP